ncbi:hypothetical protein DSECCO2_251940 [anaerobic digester metagenome]
MPAHAHKAEEGNSVAQNLFFLLLGCHALKHVNRASARLRHGVARQPDAKGREQFAREGRAIPVAEHAAPSIRLADHEIAHLGHVARGHAHGPRNGVCCGKRHRGQLGHAVRSACGHEQFNCGLPAGTGVCGRGISTTHGQQCADIG